MKELKSYFREIKRQIPGGCKKNKILRDLRLSVNDFIEENPDATFGAVVELFGTPQQIADSYTEEMPPQELQRQLKIKKWIIGIAAGTAACALLMWAIAIGIALTEQFQYAEGELIVDTVVVEESE